MKRIALIALCVLIAAGTFFACSKKEAGKKESVAEKLICGVTIFPPMNYHDESGKWTGFETEFAQAVGAKLGLAVEFQVIDWGRKFMELQSGTINCIWNGLTANVVDSATGRQRYEDVDFSYAYMLNQQSVVIRKTRANEFKTAANLVGKTVAVEAGSAGESIAKDAIGPTGRIIGSSAQIDTFLEVKSGAVDFAMVDILLAQQITASADHADLMIAPIEMPAEVYAIGFPKGSPMVARVNTVIEQLFADGTIHKIGAKYGLENTVFLNKKNIRDM